MLNGQPSVSGYSESDKALAALHPAGPDETARENEFQKRAQMARDVDAVLDDVYEVLVDDRLKSRFHPDTYARMKLGSGVRKSLNLMREVLDVANVAVWGSGATYGLMRRDGGAALTDEEAARFAAFLRLLDLDSLMERVAYLGWVHRGVYVLPYVGEDEREGVRRFGWRVYSPAHYDLVACDEDPTQWEAVRLYYEAKGRERFRTEWTRERWLLSQHSAQTGTWRPVSAEENIYGQIPGWHFSPDPYRLWSHNYGERLLESTVEVNAALTLLTYNSTAQVKALAGAFDNVPSGQVLRQGAMIDTGATGVSVLDLQTDVGAFRRTFVDSEVRAMQRALGLPMDAEDASGAPPSGESLKLRYWNRDRLGVSRRRYLVAGLKRLYWSALQVLAVEVMRTEDKDGNPLPPIAGLASRDDLPPYEDARTLEDQPYVLTVDVGDVTYPELATERQSREQYELEQGMTSPEQMLRTRNPDDPAPLETVRANLRQRALLQRDARPLTPLVMKPTTKPAGGAP